MPAPEADCPYISLVLPAYNEEDTIEEAVRQAIPPLKAVSARWEIVLVNDASRDRTSEIADRLALAWPGHVHVIHHRQNQGLGGALRSGFYAARGELLAYCDSDLPFDMMALHRAYEVMQEQKADFVAGFRFDRGSEGWHRLLYSFIYNHLVRLVFGLRVKDVNFSLKLFRRAVFDAGGLHSRGSFIDVELLAQAHRNGYRVVQLGMVYTPRTRGISTLSRPSVIFDILREMIQYRTGRLVAPEPTPSVSSVSSETLVSAPAP
jgi:glycosyltransferase involved in cell wall biosynthesis